MSSYKTDQSQIVLNYPRTLFWLYILSAAKQFSGTSGVETNETLPKSSLPVSGQTKNGTDLNISDKNPILKIPSVNKETFSESTSVSGDSAWLDADQPNLLYLSRDSLVVIDANFTNGSAIFGLEKNRNSVITAMADKSGREMLTTSITTRVESLSRTDREFATIPCDSRTHVGCKVESFERCGDRGRCQCLHGYMFSPQTGFCVAVQYFWGQLYLWRNFSLVQPWSEISNQYKLFKQQLRDKLLLVFRSQKIPGLMDIQVFQISWQMTTVEVKFQVFFDKRLSPPKKEIETLYKDGLKSPKNVHNSNGFYVFVDSHFAIRMNATQSSQITEYNPCADSTSNYCNPNAKCKHTMKSFTCTCKPGYEDTSPDISRAPGEVCSVWCGCQNNGTCQRSNGEISCRCLSWYLGEKCEINGKNLVIILCSTLGGLLLLTIIICLFCIFFCRRKARKSSSTRHLSASDSTLVKLPRLWSEAVPTHMYEVPAVSDRRRWSYVSDPIRYPEDLIQEDLFSTGTLPLPRTYDPNRRHLMAYPNPSYQSSTLPLRPPYHQDKWRSGYQPSLSIPF